VQQFDDEFQLPILREINHIFSRWYFSRVRIAGFLTGLTNTQALTGPDFAEYWRSCHFLDIQEHGGSQSAMLETFGEILRDAYQLDIEQCGTTNGPFIYLDDFIFSGSRIQNDLRPWIEETAPQNAVINVIVLGYTTYGQYAANRKIQEIIRTSGKQITIHWWRCKEIENRVAHAGNSHVLWPARIPQTPEATAYFETTQTGQYPWRTRTAGLTTNNPVFSSEAARDLLEQQLLLAGLRIRGFSQNPSNSLKPLGFIGFPSLGYGAMVATYRNCPNNCPLALWWGDPNAAATHPFHNWYPLLPRHTYENQQLAEFNIEF